MNICFYNKIIKFRKKFKNEDKHKKIRIIAL